MREKARKMPIGKCFIGPEDWRESGIAYVIVTRQRPNGHFVVGSFLLDTFCLGVKDADYYVNMSEVNFEKHLQRFEDSYGLKEISYTQAHNLVYGAIEFAEEAGIEPLARDFNIARYILEEDTEEIPLIEYEFGKDGKHFLLVGPERREMPYVRILKENLGDDFDYAVPYAEEEEENPFSDLTQEDVRNAFEKMCVNIQREREMYPREEYSYQYPEYPQSPQVRNQFIADELLSPANSSSLPREVIDRILSLPADEAAQDIGNMMLYETGQTYKAINDDTIGESENSAIMHALLLLAQLQSDKGLDALLELMRQSSGFADFHLGDLAMELVAPALYASGRDHIAAIEEYMNQPGLDLFFRSYASDALVMIVVNNPERRREIMEVYRRLLNRMTRDLPDRIACDGTFAAFVMSNLVDLRAKELIPEIKETFATGCVNPSVTGNCEKVIKLIESEDDLPDKARYQIENIYKQYDDIKRFMERD